MQTGHISGRPDNPEMSMNRQAPSPVRNHQRARNIRERRANSRRTPGHIPRPRNSWIIYRSDKTRELRDMDPSLTASDICKYSEKENELPANTFIARITSRLWASELAHVKVQYQQKAQEEANDHMARYPDYRYRARRPIPRQPTVDSMMFWDNLTDKA